MPAFLPAIGALRAAAEPTRLRLLALLARAELTVGEICRIVGQSQPRISRHLKVLTDAGLADRMREQHWVYYRAPAETSGRELVEQLLALVDADDPVLRRDVRRCAEVIAHRAEQIEQTIAGVQPAEVDAAVLQALAGAPLGALLDVGTGSGRLLTLLAPHAQRAVGVDISTDALRLARSTVHGAGLSRCELQRADMYDLPFTSPAFDTAAAESVLANASRPVAALAEIHRTLRAEGRLVVIEEFDALLERARDPIAALRAWLIEAGFECQRVQPVDAEGKHVLVAVARRVERSAAAA